MHKFIEIPIYALDKSTLRVRYEKYVDTLRREVFPDIIEETFLNLISMVLLEAGIMMVKNGNKRILIKR